jgi:glutathione S-transferase
MLKIYGSVNSRAMRVLWMAAELDLPYEHKDWLPRAPETKAPEFRALNANGRVPTIDDDGFILSESMAINLFLAKKHKSGLYPSDLKNEALALQWSLWETDRLDRQIVDYQRHVSQLPAAERKPEVAEKAWGECTAAFEVLEDALKKSKWLAGGNFSVADLNVASALYRALTVDLAKWPHVQSWLKTCWERPSAKKVRAMREK